MSKYVIAAIPLTLIDVVWEKCVPHLERAVALSHGDVTVETIKARLHTGNQLLITICEGSDVIAANVIYVHTTDTDKRLLIIPIMGGDKLDDWLEQYLEVINAIALERDCIEVRVGAGRKGWIKKLKPFGWHEMSVTIGYKLGDKL